MKKFQITVYGRVQRVGYRDAVAEIARKLGIKGTVKNLEDEVSVEIIAEGEDNKLGEFVKLINIKDHPIEVEKIEVKEEKTTGQFKYFKITRGEPNEELGERIDVAGKHLYDIKKLQLTSTEKLDTVGNKMDKFSDATQQQFQHLDGKYHSVSDRLGSIDNHLKELVNILKQFKPK